MPTIAETLAQAKACHHAGQLPEAVQLYQRILQADSGNVEVYYLLGAACHGLGKANEAITSLAQAIRLWPDYAEAHNHLGAVLAQQGKLDDAILSFEQALRLRPDSAEISKNLRLALATKDYSLANALAAQGRLDEAAVCYRRAVELNPEFSEAHNNLGAVSAQQDKSDEAAACYRRALQLKPDYPEAWSNLGVVLEQQGKLDEAATCYRRALELKPDYPEAWSNLGVILERQEKLDEAATCHRRALQLKPDYAEAHTNLAAVLAKQGSLDEAAACYRRGLQLKPVHAEAHHYLGTVLAEQGKFDEAVACCRRALELKPDFAEASSNLGILLAQQGRVAEAKECYRKAQQFNPNQDFWKLNLVSLCPIVFNSNEDIELYRRKLLSDLEDVAKENLDLDLAGLATASCRPSFNLPFHGRDDRPIREAYARLYRNRFPNETPKCSSGRPRVGFVVTDRHKKLFLKSMGGILDHIDSDLFELVVIASEHGIAMIRSTIRNQAIKLLPIPNQFDQFINAIRDAHFDLLYYWEVATDNINYFLPFFRLAPVQCTSWGIQATSGIPQLDQYLSSALVESEDAQNHYTENLVLASTLLTYQQRVSAPTSPKHREYFGIAQEQHLYLCAQQLGKFQPDFDPILAGILREDAKGVVVATEDRYGGFSANQLRQRFAATLPDVADRIVFIPQQPNPDYLSLIAAADVLLDPLHFGGVNSSYDGFSLNKPIVTLPSQFQRGRYTLGCYKKMGLSDCIASDQRQYIEIAVALATDVAFRSKVVEKIRRASPVLFEDLEAVREHERIFGALVEEARSAHHADRV